MCSAFLGYVIARRNDEANSSQCIGAKARRRDCRAIARNDSRLKLLKILALFQIYFQLCAMPAKRYIMHIDLDSFFVSVERLYDPSLIGKPVIIGGNAQRGVVASCSYEARKFGVHSGMSSRDAFRLCPHAISVRGNHERYSDYSRRVTKIIDEMVPLYQKASVDEFYIDLTGTDRFYDPYQLATQVRQRIIKETKLPISFGLASGRTVAKMATNRAKPNGQLFVPHGSEMDFLAPFFAGFSPSSSSSSSLSAAGSIWR